MHQFMFDFTAKPRSDLIRETMYVCACVLQLSWREATTRRTRAWWHRPKFSRRLQVWGEERNICRSVEELSFSLALALRAPKGALNSLSMSDHTQWERLRKLSSPKTAISPGRTQTLDRALICTHQEQISCQHAGMSNFVRRVSI